MAWLDDRIWAHPKITNIPRATRWEYAAALAYASGFNTGGVLTAGQLKVIECTKRDRELLIKVGLWQDAGRGSIRIHDWSDHNGKRDAKKEADRLRKRAARAKEAETSAGHEADKHATEEAASAGQASDRPRARDRRRAPDDGVTSEEGPDTTAADTPKSTSRTTEASYAEKPKTEDQETPAAVVAPATEQEILAACTRFGAEPNIAEPWARQLSGDELQAIVLKMEMKIRRGTVETPPGHFVDLLKRKVAANVKAASAVKIHIPTIDETLHGDVVQYARGHHPWEVAADLLGRKMTKLDVPAERHDELLAELERVYRANAEAA